VTVCSPSRDSTTCSSVAFQARSQAALRELATGTMSAEATTEPILQLLAEEASVHRPGRWRLSQGATTTIALAGTNYP
jgi:hypothetical protein